MCDDPLSAPSQESECGVLPLHLPVGKLFFRFILRTFCFTQLDSGSGTKKEQESYGFCKEEASQEDRQAQAPEAVEVHATQEQVIVTAGTNSPRVFYSVCRMLAELMLCGHVAFGASSLAEPPSPPADLRLEAAELRQCQALSHFAWGLLAQFEEKEAASARADKHLREALALSPRSLFAAEALVYPMLMRRDFDGIADALRPALLAAPGCEHLVLLAANALEAGEKPNEAVRCLEDGLRAGKWRSGRLVRALFVLLWDQGQKGSAEKLLRRAGRKRSLRHTFDYQYAAAYHASAMGKRRKTQQSLDNRQVRYREAAAEHARRAAYAATQNDDSEEIGLVADLLIEAGEWDEARALLDRLADQYDDPDLWLLKARVMARSGATAQLVAYLDGLVADYLSPESFPEAADILINADQPEAAMRIFRHYLAGDPDSVTARLQLAWIHHGLQQPKLALDVLRPVEDLQAHGLLLTAYLHRELGDSALALQAVERAKTRAREEQQTGFLTVDLYQFCALLQEAVGNVPAAIEAARQALALSPQSAECANFLGYLLADHNQDLPEAEKLIRAALAEENGSAAYLDSLAWVLYRQGCTSMALVTMQRALRAGGDSDPVVLDHAADICTAQGLHGLARVYWIEALAADPPDRDAILRKLQATGTVDDHAWDHYFPLSRDE